jgi:quercetin dioxygenase-like cupin family protein
MITRRELFAVLGAAAVTDGAFALDGKPMVMGSAAFDWNSIAAKPNASGSVRSFFKARTATLEELELHATTLEPGKAPHPPHRHPNEEMIILWKGTLEALENGEWKRVGPGSVIFNASNQLHGLRNAGADQAVYHVINWKTAATPAPLPQ